jgi:hypothetical protein
VATFWPAPPAVARTGVELSVFIELLTVMVVVVEVVVAGVPLSTNSFSCGYSYHYTTVVIYIKRAKETLLSSVDFNHLFL